MTARPDLPRVGIFADLTDAELDQLRRATTEQDVAAGQDLIVQGRSATRLHLLVQGQAGVSAALGGRVRDLAVIGPGAFVGELGLLHGMAATATVTARTDVRTRACDATQLDDLFSIASVRERVHATADRRLRTLAVAELAPVRLTDDQGRPLTIRPLWPDDWRLMEAGLEDISPTSLYRRFLTSPKLGEHALRRLADVDYRHDFAWLVSDAEAPDDRAGLAVGRLAHRPSPGQPSGHAEFALLVTDAAQGRGVGRRLLVALAVAAESMGVTVLEGITLADNTPLLGLVRSAGGTVGPDADPTLRQVHLDVADLLATSPHGDLVDPLRRLVRRSTA